MEKKEELLETSRHVMDLQERELEDAKDELNLAEHENKLLRKSMELLSEEADVNRCVEPYWLGKKKIVYSGMQKKNPKQTEL